MGDDIRGSLTRRVGQLALTGGTLSQTAGKILAPILGAWVQWILGRALEEQVERLYFLARDGWFPYHMAWELCRKWGLPIECRYLYGSRYAWRLPLFHKDREKALEQILGKGGASCEGFLKQGGLTQGERQAVLEQLGIPNTQWISLEERDRFAEKLGECALFWEYVEKQSQAAASAWRAYLKQEGLLEPISWVLVDSGWMGSTQQTLKEGLKDMGWPGEVSGYYAGLYRKPLSGKWDCFFFRPGRNLLVRQGMEPSFFEGVFSAPHGMTLGYQITSQGVVPLLGEPPLKGWAFQELSRVFQAYGKLLGEESPPPSLREKGEQERDLLWTDFKRLMTRPTQEEALALGSLPFSSRPMEEPGQCLARKLSDKELEYWHLGHRVLGGTPSKGSPWLPGSAALYGKNPTRHFQAFGRARLVKGLRDTVQNFGLGS